MGSCWDVAWGPESPEREESENELIGSIGCPWGQKAPQREDGERLCFPWSAVIYNISLTGRDTSMNSSKSLGPKGSDMLDFFQKFNPETARVFKGRHPGELGKCVLEFKGDSEGFMDAQAFERWFSDTDHGVKDYKRHSGNEELIGNGWYGWLARQADHDGREGQADNVGKYLQAIAEPMDLGAVSEALWNEQAGSEEAFKRILQERIEEEKDKGAEALKEAEAEIANQGTTIMALVTKGREDTDELEAARKLCVKAITDHGSDKTLYVKRMGEIFQDPWETACQAVFSNNQGDNDGRDWEFRHDWQVRRDWEVRCKEMLSEWEERIKDPFYHPFKNVLREGTNDTWKCEVDREDPHLCELRTTLGEEVCQTVIVALQDILKYNASGRYPVAVVWNFRSDRRATIREIIACLLEVMETNKPRKRSRGQVPAVPASTRLQGGKS